MLHGILSDANCEGHFQVVLRALHDAERCEFWHHLNLAILTFGDLDLAADSSDRVLRERCQSRNVLLVTGNRNAKGADSLEEIIRTRNTTTSIPVVTLASMEKILRSRAYATAVADGLLDLLYSFDDLRGAGRLFLP